MSAVLHSLLIEDQADDRLTVRVIDDECGTLSVKSDRGMEVYLDRDAAEALREFIVRHKPKRQQA